MMTSKPGQSSTRQRFSIYEVYLKHYGIGRSNPSIDPYWPKNGQRHGKEDRPWWPMRYFMDDWILGVWVYRVRRRDEMFEVALFLTEDHTKYVKGSSMRGTLLCMLTQAFHLLGKMEIAFVGPKPRGRERIGRDKLIQRHVKQLEDLNPTTAVRGQQSWNDIDRLLSIGFEPGIPPAIRHFAKTLGVTFADDFVIADSEGRDLYLRLTGFSDHCIRAFNQRGIDLTRACVVAQKDIWSLESVEYLLKYAPAPERLFDGGADVLKRGHYLHDLLAMRVALMEERLRLKLEHFSQPLARPKGIKAEWLSATCVRYVSGVEYSIDLVGGTTVSIKAGQPISVCLVPRDVSSYVACRHHDALAVAMGGKFYAVTRDYESAQIQGTLPIKIISLFDTLNDLDTEAELRLAQAAGARSELSERHT